MVLYEGLGLQQWVQYVTVFSVPSPLELSTRIYIEQHNFNWIFSHIFLYIINHHKAGISHFLQSLWSPTMWLPTVWFCSFSPQNRHYYLSPLLLLFFCSPTSRNPYSFLIHAFPGLITFHLLKLFMKVFF